MRNLCVEGAYVGDGECHICDCDESASDILPFVFAICGAVASVYFVTVVVSRNVLVQSNLTLLCVLMLGILFTSIQTLGFFHELSISWIEPLRLMQSYMVLLNFDLKFLKADCVLRLTRCCASRLDSSSRHWGFPLHLLCLSSRRGSLQPSRTSV